MVERLVSADLMREILQKHDYIRQILPTAQQVRILKFVEVSYEVVSSDLANFMQISIANASAQLNKLQRNGWLVRSDVGDPTGGSLYVYKLAH